MKSIIIFVLSCMSFCLYAQTTGPTQPEVTSFTPVSASEMVDYYSGDFNYNIPLLVVPGPDGGYPINISYNSNIRMTDASSLTGLGFNLNTGAIVRNKRGIPDDFRGDGDNPDMIEQTTYLKPKKNISIGLSNLKTEIFSGDLGLKGKVTIYYDNYKGFGAKAGLDLGPQHDCSEHALMSKGAWSLGLDFDSKEGIQLSPKISIDHILSKKIREKNEGSKEKNSEGKQGRLDKMRTFNIAYCDKNNSAYDKDYTQKANLSFSKFAPVGKIAHAHSMTSVKYAAIFDVSTPILKLKSVGLEGNLSISKLRNPIKTAPLFGSLYTVYGADNPSAILDAFKENEIAVSKEIPLLPITISSDDIFIVQGHGVGGSFRLFRNDVGQFKAEYVETKGTNVELGTDFGAGAGAFDLGVDANYAVSKSYTGAWKDTRINSLDSYSFKTKNVRNPLYEPAYFKMIGEASPLPIDQWKYMEKDKPIAFDLGGWTDILSKPFSFKAKAFSTYNSGKNKLDVNNMIDRNPRVTNIEYKTKAEIQDRSILDNFYNAKYIITENNSLTPINYSKGKLHHIHEMIVRKSNGTTYHYALPAYNSNEETVTFATNQKDPGQTKKIPINGLDKVNNKVSSQIKGSDDFYSKEVMPPYAHTYFLTSIHSVDYVDIKNDGPTDDDLGTWTKFYYQEVQGYKWRFPFDNQMADFIEGFITNKEDNKGTYTQGVKDLYYVKAIETKTHIATFETGSSALIDANNAKAQKYLKKISLYSKSDLNYSDGFFLNTAHTLIPIKEIHFAYDYSLKSNQSATSTVPNFNTRLASTDNILGTIGQSGQNGTLTLKELWFTYKENGVGADSKYLFDYKQNRPHPKDATQDRWGTYHKIPTVDQANLQEQQNENLIHNPYYNPYTYQEKDDFRNEKAAMWCLSKITLPSDGEIHIEYEKDDYAFVQNEKATEYVSIQGFGKTDNTFWDLKNIDIDDLKQMDKIYFKASSDAEAKARVKGIKDLNFKAYMHLNTVRKIGVGNIAHHDYINGYLPQSEWKVGYDVGKGLGYIQVNNIQPTNSTQFKLHPFQMAALQYIRNYRPDIQTSFEFTSDDPIDFVSNNFSKLFAAIKPLFTGYYKNKASKGWGGKVLKKRPSFLKLNSINRKYGGGNRVKKIELFSKNINNRVYGKEYQYILKDGSSSGVAEMEPIVGHEENGLVKPVWYNQKTGEKFLFIQKESESSFVELPIGVSLYPGAKIGYSRVLERALTNKNEVVSKTQDGVTVYEFYTAKDHPTIAKRTDNPFKTKMPPINVEIPFVGAVGINNGGFSMGYSFTLNNGIYGRQKSVSVFPYSEQYPIGQPVSKVEYIYQTSANGKLDNEVKFLKQEGQVETALLGKEFDFYLDQYENGNITIGGGIRPDIKFSPLTIPWPSMLPSIQYYENVSSYLTTTKVIYNTPILKETIQYKDGAKVISSNLYYDYETGQPIITGITNEFQDTIFSYNFPAHWTYDRMDGAYKNQRSTFNVKNGIGNKFRMDNVAKNVADILFEGDELMIEQKKYFVSNINRNANDFDLTDRLNNRLAISGSLTKVAYVERSGFRNLQSVSKGGIVSLKDYSEFDFFTNDMSNGEVIRKPILQTNAVEFSEDWDLNFTDLPDELTDANGRTLSDIYQNGTANPYAFGKLGIPRTLRTWAYIQSRDQNEDPTKGPGAGLKIAKDGTFEYFPFNWVEDTLFNERADWRWVNQVTKYNSNGTSEEGKNRLHQFAANLSGYKNFLVTAAAENAERREIAFDGFEDYDLNSTNNYSGNGHGNLNLNRYWLYPEGHTGSFSLNLADGLACPTCFFEFESDLNGAEIYFTPKRNKKYVLSFWTKFSQRNTMPFNPPPTKVQVLSGNTVVKTFTVDPRTNMIDGWYKVEGEFELPTSASKFKLRLFAVEDDDVLLDDLRIQPFNASMKAYVYDPNDYTLQAILNDHNYFVEFIYDSEGGLIQKNVETELGKKTISINRSNVSKR